MSDGYDDRSPQDERQRERSRSCERVNAHTQAPQIPQIQPMVTPELDAGSDEDATAMNPSLPSAGPPPPAEQRGRSRRDQRSRSRERVPPHSSSHASQQPATQGADEGSATEDPQNRVSDRSRSPQGQEGSQRQGPKTLKRKNSNAEKAAE